MVGIEQAPIALAINDGSSSLKVAYFELASAGDQLLLNAQARQEATGHTRFKVQNDAGHVLHEEFRMGVSQRDRFEELMRICEAYQPENPSIVGHRLVHGGPNLRKHTLLDEPAMLQLRAATHFAPNHLPESIELIELAKSKLPRIPHVACFDTTFHRTMPLAAKRLPIPTHCYNDGIERYGFHGLSYSSVVERLKETSPSRLIIAHLGNGASLCAVRDGHSIDTTMSFTPTGGVPMSTRSGDLDPGVLLFLMRNKHLDADSLERMLTKDSGLKGISNHSGDMLDLLAHCDLEEPEATLALQMFTLSVRKQIGAYVALLGGVDLLVFTGGIGEHNEVVRDMICGGLDSLGVHLRGPSANVVVMAAEEERQIASICRCFL